jgi:hypothetical protein
LDPRRARVRRRPGHLLERRQKIREFKDLERAFSVGAFLLTYKFKGNAPGRFVPDRLLRAYGTVPKCAGSVTLKL